jgi:hypothetical protein
MMVLDAIRLTSQYAIAHPEEFSQKVREASEIKQSKAAREMKRKITQAKKRSTELDGLIKKLYESYAQGMITESRFALLLGGYEKEQAEVNALIETEQAQLDSYEADSEKVSQFMALAKKYTDFSELTPQMIYEFVEKIIVHAPEKIDGERTQEVEIQLKYIGSFDLPESPMPDPTPAEIAAEEKKQRRRDTNHRYYEKRKGQGQAAQKNEDDASSAVKVADEEKSA